jgi:hypothetical protein
MKRTFEAWDDGENGITLTLASEIERQRTTGAISAAAKRLHVIEADTWEEAAAMHAIKMGWGPYNPGPSAPCPRGCGAFYYPEGSGECPNCGFVG